MCVMKSILRAKTVHHPRFFLKAYLILTPRSDLAPSGKFDFRQAAAGGAFIHADL